MFNSARPTSLTARLGRGRVAVAATAVMAVVATAACSSGGVNDEAAGNSDASGLVAEMQEVLDAASGQPEFQAPPALDASQLAGRTVAIVAIDLRVPALAEVTESARKAAEQAGLKTTVFDGQGNPTLVNQGLTQAINNKVGAVLSVGLVVDLISNQIRQAKDAGIPMVDVINTPPDADAPGQGSDPNMFANVAPDSAHVGSLLGATAIVEREGKANVAIMNTSELTVASTIVGAMKETLDQCDSCEYTETDTALVEWATELPNQASSVVRSNPNVNFMLPIYDAMTLFASSGVRQAGGAGKVQMASFNGTAPALDLVAEGDIAVANVAQNNDWAAWAAIDQAMRGMLKMDPADPVLPVRYVTTEDLEGIDTSSQPAVNEALFGTDYRQGYLAAWGLA